MLDRFTRPSDVVCRASADEFLVTLPETGGREATEAFGRILLELEAAESPPLTCISLSVGIAIWQSGMEGRELMAKASQALDRARIAGADARS